MADSFFPRPASQQHHCFCHHDNVQQATDSLQQRAWRGRQVSGDSQPVRDGLDNSGCVWRNADCVHGVVAVWVCSEGRSEIELDWITTACNMLSCHVLLIYSTQSGNIQVCHNKLPRKLALRQTVITSLCRYTSRILTSCTGECRCPGSRCDNRACCFSDKTVDTKSRFFPFRKPAYISECPHFDVSRGLPRFLHANAR